MRDYWGSEKEFVVSVGCLGCSNHQERRWTDYYSSMLAVNNMCVDNHPKISLSVSRG
jgi:hypothetical protein